MRDLSAINFWGFIAAIIIEAFIALSISLRAMRSHGRERRILLVAASLAVFTIALFVIFYVYNTNTWSPGA
jgi:uncharacterized membrane protein